MYNNNKRQNKEKGHCNSLNGGPQRGRSQTGFVGILPTTSEQSTSSSSSSLMMDSEISSILECPVCFGVPKMEVYNCENGHSVCGKCCHRLTRCALCTAPFRGARNYVMESLISKYKQIGMPLDERKPLSSRTMRTVVCEHVNEGCQKSLLNCEVAAHGSQCEFRPVRCIVDCKSITRCPKTKFFKLSDYFNHLLNEHKITGLTEPSGIFTKTDRLFIGLEINTNWSPFYLQYDGRIFLRNASIRNRVVFWWIQLIGPDSESRKYMATISLRNPKMPNVKIAWTVPVYSIRSEKKTIEQSNIAAISTTRILPFCSLNEKFEDRVVTHRWDCHITLTCSYMS